LTAFRRQFYDCLTARTDALFELADAVLCADGPVHSLVELSPGPRQSRDGVRLEWFGVEAPVLVAARRA
jgi:hypothetical protein